MQTCLKVESPSHGHIFSFLVFDMTERYRQYPVKNNLNYLNIPFKTEDMTFYR